MPERTDVVLYAEDEEDRARVRGALPDARVTAPQRILTAAQAREINAAKEDDEAEVKPTKETDDERRALATASCILFLYHEDRLDVWFEWMADVGRRFPGVPLVLITEKSAESARLVSPLEIARVVWLEEIEEGLPRVVETVGIESSLSGLAPRIPDDALPPAGLRAVRLALRALPPYHDVHALASDADCRPVTLRQEVGRAASGRFRLEDLLNAIEVVHARRNRAAGKSWDDTASALSSSRRTLQNRVHAWPGCTLSELDRVEPAKLLRWFERDFIELFRSG